MLKRSKSEFYADWYRIASNELIRQIKSTADDSTESVSEQDVIDSITMLSICCEEGVEITSPCTIQYWQGDGDPGPEEYKRHDNQGFSNNWMNLKVFETYPGELEVYPARVTLFEGGYRRLLFDTEFTFNENIAMGEYESHWFHLDKHGERILHALESYLERDEVQIKHRPTASSSTPIPFDLDQTANEIKELASRYKEWFTKPDSKEHRNLVGAQVQRLWIVMNYGQIDLLDAKPEVRKSLLEVWRRIEWSQRWVELGLLQQENDFISQYAALLHSPTDLDLENLAATLGESQNGTLTEPTAKRRVSAEERHMLISASLMKYHKDQLHGEPIKLRWLENELNYVVSTGALSNWFKEYFGSHKEYCQDCRRSFGDLKRKLERLNEAPKVDKKGLSLNFEAEQAEDEENPFAYDHESEGDSHDGYGDEMDENWSADDYSENEWNEDENWPEDEYSDDEWK